MTDVVGELAFRPLFFRRGDVALRQLLAERPGVMVFDEIQGLLDELVRTKSPQCTFSGKELAAAVDEHLDGTPPQDYGVWVYYPWSRRLVHLLDEQEFAFLRTNRSRCVQFSSSSVTVRPENLRGASTPLNIGSLSSALRSILQGEQNGRIQNA